MEHQLHQHFFPAGAGEGEGGGLEALMEPLCVLLYDALRPRFILLQRLEDLAELLDILQHEVPPPPPGTGLHPRAQRRPLQHHCLMLSGGRVSLAHQHSSDWYHRASLGVLWGLVQQHHRGKGRQRQSLE